MMNSFGHGMGRSIARMAAGIVVLGALAAAAPAAAQAQPGGKLTVMLQQEPALLNLGIDTGAIVQTISGGKIIQSLVSLDFDVQPTPLLAKSWDISEDGLVYTFNLQEGVTWHDGAPFTAADVVFSTTVFLPETHSRARAVLANVASVEALDPLTVRFTLKGPYAPFMTGMSGVNMPILPKHVYEGTAFRDNPANLAPIGTGPFKLQEWRRGDYVHLVRNENYWRDGKPYLDEIYFLVLPDQAQRAVALETRRADVALALQLEPFDEDRLIATGDFVAHKGGYNAVGAVTMVQINKREFPFSDVRYRKALQHAIDKEFIFENIVFGRGAVAHGPIASGTAFYDGDALVKYAYDPAKANALLDEIGLARGPNGIRQSLEFTMTVGGAGVNLRISEFLKQQLAEVGIEANLLSPDRATYTDKETNWNYALLLGGLGQFLDPAIGVRRNYTCDNVQKVYQTNTGGYCNPRVDELWSMAIATTDRTEAQRHYSEIQKIISDEVPTVWIYERDDWIIGRANLKNIVNGPFGPADSWDEVFFER